MAGRDTLRLERLKRAQTAALIQMAEEFRAEGDERFSVLLDDTDAFFELAESFRLGKDLPSNRVQQTHFLLFKGGNLLGSARLRHRLIPILHRDGGNIGYEIRRSERGNGYGTRLLALMLGEARQIGLSRALVTVGQHNRASIRVVEKNGGIFDGSSNSPATSEVMLRYWISLTGDVDANNEQPANTS